MSTLGDSKAPSNFPRLIFNSDGDSTTHRGNDRESTTIDMHRHPAD